MAEPIARVLLELARQDPRIFGVSCDCWSLLSPLAEEFPGRAVEVGIAEQNLIGVSAGLALWGKVPFAVGMNPFVTMRCFEQIRTDVAYGGRNVKIIGAYGSGLMFAGWGSTHHAMEEIGLMRLIPTMTVIMPADSYETERAVRAAAVAEGPFYISLARGGLPIDVPEEERVFEVGRASVLRDGDDVTIIATGSTVVDALQAATALSGEGVSARVLSMHTVKPIDRDAIAQAARTRLVIAIEEHTIMGGLGSAVAEVMAEAGVATPLRRLGLQDTFAIMVGSHQEMKQRFRISAEAIVQTVRQLA